MALVLSAAALSAAAALAGGLAAPAGAAAVRPGAAAGCPPPTARHAWAVSVSDTGKVRWQAPLPVRGNAVGSAISPVIAGPVAVLAQDGTVYGVRLADGRRLWAWSGGQLVYGMWRSGGLVVVLTDQVSDHARLTALATATGAVRWTVRLPGQGLYGGQAATADGGLAMTREDGTLQVVNLADGAVRWARRTGTTPVPAVAAGLVLAGVNGTVAAFDTRTGARRWVVRGVPGQPALQAADGLVLVTSAAQGPGLPTAVTAIAPSAGRVAWRFDPGSPVTVLGAGRAGLTVATYAAVPRLYLLDPATGRPRWHVNASAGLGQPPVVTGADVIVIEGTSQLRLTDRDAADGRVRWQHPLGLVEAIGPVLAGPRLAAGLTNPGRPGQPSYLAAYRIAGGGPAWRVAMPAYVPGPPAVLPGGAGLVVQPADPAQACEA
jgi:outer membrane protein assembly factor BamB